MKASIRYHIAVLDPRQHLFRVRLEIDQAKGTLRLRLPPTI